ncbi:hypothetical protein G6O67_005082 [Ophiocordyceps sinensis]|uniref:Uncharacterized protein n=1 Tax=Ophiocordyceps sinensis TaxID=72228 RepID=A0A8H4PQU4_9HYPO|nr:hypothetical protein G6O67_005082 [Ophiocordyceps sinensis]
MALAPLFVLLLATVAMAAPAPQSSPSSDASQQGKCVHGSPTKTENYDIMYQQVKPPSSDGNNNFIVDPAWLKRHSTVGSSIQMSMGNPFISYGEFKCQYSCGGIPGCVSYAGYQSTVVGSHKKFECYFFDSLIESKNLVPAPDAENNVMTHAYNKLCDDK